MSVRREGMIVEGDSFSGGQDLGGLSPMIKVLPFVSAIAAGVGGVRRSE